MLNSLQTSYGQQVDDATLQQVAGFNHQIGRIDGQSLNAHEAADRCQEHLQNGLAPLITLRRPDQTVMLPEGVFGVELWNEPELHKSTDDPALSPEEYRARAQEMAEGCPTGIQLYGPTIANLNRRGLDYLHKVWPLPERFKVSMHRYPYGDKPQSPHPGASSRADEVRQLRDIIGDRAFGVSECGYHTALRKYDDWRRNFFPRVHPPSWIDPQIVEFRKWERRFWEEQGAEFLSWFCLDDGPRDIPDHRSGIRYWNTVEDRPGDWKPQARA
jgi:hypothetical protein